MVTQGLTPSAVTFEEIKRWTSAEMKDQLRRSDEMRQAIYKIIQSKSEADVLAAQAQIDANQPAPVEEPVPEVLSPEPVPIAEVPVGDSVEIDLQFAEREAAAAAEVEAARVAVATLAHEADVAREAAQAEETAALAAAGITAQRDQHGNISKLVQDYQVLDDNKNPIGRPTHLEARGWPELAAKQKEAHSQATRAFNRLKNQKVTFKEQVVERPTSKFSDQELLEAMKDLKSDDPTKQLEAVRKVGQADRDRYSAERDAKDAEAVEFRRQEDVSRRFLVRHKDDFYNCQANIKSLGDYFQENQLAWTDDNLDIAFHALESELAPVERPTAFTPPANPVKVEEKVTTQVAPVVQPPAPAPAQAPTPVNPVVAAPRPGVNGGIEPGSMSSPRPAPTKPKLLGVEEVNSWDAGTMRAKMRDPKMRPQIEAFIAARNKQRT